MNHSIDDILTDLVIISKLKENGKFIVRNGNFTLENSHKYENTILNNMFKFKTSLTRWYFHDNRNNALLHIQSIILQAFHSYEKISKDNKLKSEIWYQNQILTKLNESLCGLEILKNTYENDAKFCSKINIIIEHINQFIDDKSKAEIKTNS